MSAAMSPDEMHVEAEAFVRRCVVGIECSEDEIKRAAKAAYEAFTWRIDAIRLSGFRKWGASGMSTGTAKTPKAVEGRSPASPVANGETPNPSPSPEPPVE